MKGLVGFIRRVLVMLLVGIVLLNITLYLRQPAMVFYPMATIVETPADWGMAYEAVTLATTDGDTLSGWYLPAEASDRVILLLHGNAGNISHRREILSLLHELGASVFIFDYRGYGASSGTPDEQGLYRDTDAAWRYLVQTRGIAPQNIVIFGRSLGGMLGAELASRVPAAGLVLDSTFSSAHDMAQVIYPGLANLLLLRYQFDTVAALQKVSEPLLVIHSREDEIIPYQLGQKVFAAAAEPKTLVTIHGSHNHAFLQSREAYRAALRTFFNSLTQSDKQITMDRSHP